ncbi:MAG: histidine kinase [Betaproteobacteria bacterium]|nr:histidine kinase [Betaproteobacteria bacterium]MDE2046936.1 histidine kinase [Betaproteobacteria bacterium]
MTPSTTLPAAAPSFRQRLWTTYFLGWIPLFLIYAVATNNDWDFRKGFDFLDALFGGAWGIGPAVLLLTALWPITGWMERRAMGPLSTVLLHMLLAAVFAVVWHASIYGFLYVVFSPRAAQKSADSWFIWQSMWGMMLYAAVAGGFHAVRAIERARSQAAAAAQAEALLSRSELAALRNKLNPHFLFNTLHSIIALTRRQPQQAEEALLKFAEMLRYLLDTEKSGDDHVTLRHELDFVRDYLALEALRLGPRLQVSWQVDDSVLGSVVPALSIQPLVENSIKHAFNPRTAAGHLALSVTRAGSPPRLQVQVRDDGPGCDAGMLAASTGLGLRTVERRLQLAYGVSGVMKVVTAAAQGFAVEWSIPLKGEV